MLTGVYKPMTGKFLLCGEDLTGKSPSEINKKGIARTFQNIRLFSNMSVIDNVLVGMNNQSKCGVVNSVLRLPRFWKTERSLREAARELLAVFDLDGERRVLASNLPYGKQRKLEIARALATKPKLLLLDEPAAGMNPQETLELKSLILHLRKEFDLSILLIEHDMGMVMSLSDRIYVMEYGSRIAMGTPQEVRENPRVIKAYLGESDHA